MANTRILVVDDDPSILKFVGANLKAREYEVIVAHDGETALRCMEENLPDLVILDITMPGIDGIEVCRRIREWSGTPIIILSAKDAMSDKISLLDLGADDYLSKPFGLEELLARIRAVLRRKSGAASSEATKGTSTFSSGDLTVNFADRRVTVRGKDVDLSPTEYNLLRELVLNADKVLTFQILLSKVWGAEYADEREYLRVYINRLRNKIEADPRNPKHTLTMTGVGYCFRKQPSA